MSLELNKVRKLYNNKQFDAAQRLSSQLLLKEADNVELLLLTSKIEFAVNNITSAFKYIDKAIEIGGGSAALLIDKAEFYLVMQNNLQAVKCVELALEIKPYEFDILDSAANIYSICNMHHEARDTLLLALEQQPDNAMILYNLATRLRFIGDTKGALKNLDRVIELTPEHSEAIYVRSTSAKQTADSNHIEFIKNRIKMPNQNPLVISSLYYALAKEYEDLEEWDKSFEALSLGASSRRSSFQYNSNKYNAGLARTCTYFNEDFINNKAEGCGSKAPIFILGLPRTGSTLLDTIISGHSKIISGGELPDFPNALKQAITLEHRKTPIKNRDMMSVALDIDYKTLGEKYIDSVSKKLGSAEFFTDKLPLNFQYCGLINKALPKAKIIHIHRDPMDTCYSIYKALFLNAYPYSYDMGEIADYYITYRRIMEHWQNVMGENILEIKYENLVSDLETEAKKIIDWCGLDWDENCLNFQENKAAVTTLSAPQVRQKLYTSSIGKWRHYENQLKPITQRLDEAGIPYS